MFPNSLLRLLQCSIVGGSFYNFCRFTFAIFIALSLHYGGGMSSTLTAPSFHTVVGRGCFSNFIPYGWRGVFSHSFSEFTCMIALPLYLSILCATGGFSMSSPSEFFAVLYHSILFCWRSAHFFCSSIIPHCRRGNDLCLFEISSSCHPSCSIILFYTVVKTGCPLCFDHL